MTSITAAHIVAFVSVSLEWEPALYTMLPSSVCNQELSNVFY